MHLHRERLVIRICPALAFSFAIVSAMLTGCNYTNCHAANQIGKVQYKLGNYHDAYYEFRRAALDQPDNADFHYNVAAALNKQGNVVAAEKAYRQALHKDPAHQPSYHALARLMKGQGRVTEAKDLLSAWVDTQPYNSGSHIEMAALYRETGDLAAAEKSLQTALQVQPNHPIALAHLGQVYQDSGQHDRAIALYQRSLYKHWQQPQVSSRLAALRGPYAPSLTSRYAGIPSFYRSHPAFINRNAGLPPFGRYAQGWSPTGLTTGGIYSNPNSIALEPIPMDPALIPNADPAHATQLGSETPEGENR